jgi:uncharacterized protein YjbJ (UPF0337 family)
MNEDKIMGEGRDITGKLKETAGDLTGSGALQREGLADQIGGKVQKVYGAARDTFADGAGPSAEQAIRYAREQPFVTAAIAGALGFAIALLWRRN